MYSSLMILQVQYGECWALVADVKSSKKILRLPVRVKPIGIIALGYPTETLERLERIELYNLVYYEGYVRIKQAVRWCV